MGSFEARVNRRWEEQDALTVTITKIVPLEGHTRYTVTVDGGQPERVAFGRPDAAGAAHDAVRQYAGKAGEPALTSSGTIRGTWNPERRRWTFTFDIYGWTPLYPTR